MNKRGKMAKLIGYILSLVGLLGVVIYEFPTMATYFSIPSSLIGMPFAIVAVAVTLIGVFMIAKSGGGGKQPKEVPIYRGKNIVGYRQQK